jgi:hypothetical protein
MTKTFHIGDLVRYCDNFIVSRLNEDEANFVGTVVGFSRDSNNRTRIKVDWFDWFGTGPTQTVEYFSELQLISGER